MVQILQGEKMSNLATKPKFALATLIGLIAGVVSAFVKWGAEVPLLGLTPPLWTLPWCEYVSELVGHMVWFWSIEIIRHDLRARITKEKDPSDCCNA